MNIAPRTILDALVSALPISLAIVSVVAALTAAIHAILSKRDNRAALAWVGLVTFVPLVGSVLYLLFGINRVRRRAQALRRSVRRPPPAPMVGSISSVPHLQSLARVNSGVGPLLDGNEVQILDGGAEAFKSMLAAIDEAAESISLMTYIFDRDRIGRRFAAALVNAAHRGVQVRVLVDDAGARYSWPTIMGLLEAPGLSAARFNKTLLPWRMTYMNLRNHRKVMVVDGQFGFTGGMNIRSGHDLTDPGPSPARDLQFRLRGPIVAELQETFRSDWAFTTGEDLTGVAWFSELTSVGTVGCRVIADGPDEDLHRLRWTLHGAIASAQSSIRILTPYFLPDQGLIAALTTAASRGVEVDIVLPGRTNLFLVQWASSSLLWQLLERGCRVHRTPAPFDHSKLMVVDRSWALIGSFNWDPRSLRLNFELGVECYGRDLAQRLDAVVASRLAAGRQISLQEVDARSGLVRLRDGAARLFQPFL